jgi:hypothetical protein
MKQQKTLIVIQRVNLWWLFIGKLLLSILIIWNLTLHNTLALPIFLSEQKPTTEKLLANQLSAPPNITKLVRKDLSQRTKIAMDEIKIRNSQQMTWPNGCLGLAKTDEVCTQMLVQGWQITLEKGKTTWIYRTDSQGKMIRLEGLK